MKWIAALLLAAAPAAATTISGRVVDEQNRPMPGVSLTAYALNFADCCAEEVFAVSEANGNFRFDNRPAGVHAVITAGFSRWNPAAARVDTTSSDVSGVVLQMKPGLPRFLPDDAPRAALISAAADESGRSRVTGAPGAVPPSSYVILVTLETGDLTVVNATADGAFTADHFAPAGTSILIKADAIGIVARNALAEAKFGGEGALAGSTGTIVRVATPPSSDGSIAVIGAGSFACCNFGSPPIWTFTGTMAKTTFAPGEAIRIRGTLEARTTKYTSIPVSVNLALEPVGPANSFFSSSLTTPTGFPIERPERAPFEGSRTVNVTLAPAGEGRLRAEVDITATASARPGWFRPRLECFAFSVANETRGPNVLFVDKSTRFKRNWMGAPVIRIGTPPVPSLHWVLLADHVSEGVAGVGSVEDRGAFGATNRIAMSADTFVVPRIDPFSGETLRYRLEPFVPQISVGDRGIPPSVPFIPFKFPSGKLTLRVHKPNGAVLAAGPSPFVQSRMATVAGRDGFTIDAGGGHMTDVYQITTGDPAFDVAFDADGLHLIELDGEIEDLWGNRWSGRGTYRIHVARPIAVDTATMPGTPFEVGDTFNAGAIVPGYDHCEVAVEVALNQRRWSIRGGANRFGAFQPAESVQFTEPGEYRADVIATCTDDSGNAAVGMRTWGGVVAPREQQRVVLHGHRGIDEAPGGLQWFFRSQTPAQPIPQSHVNVPFHSGDVLWMEKNDATTTAATIQDLDGSLTPLLRSRTNGDKTAFDSKASIGEIPLFSSRADLFDPATDPSRVDLWAYSYRAVERPAIRVREQVAEDGVPSMYWRFRAQYGRQSGVGRNGDLPNDFKFQFGGAVLRGSALANPIHAIYGSLFILVPDDDPGGGTRAFPPFTSDGGPLFTLKGKRVDMFFHPTGVRPGSVLVQGDRASFTGYCAPTLPLKITIDVTAPSGRVRSINGQANKIGWFYDSGHDFNVDEPGVWKATVRLTFEGSTSAGPVQAPFPTAEQTFRFYVVRGDAAAPGVSSAQRFVRPADGPISFTITPPAGLHDLQLDYTSTMPGFVLEEGTTAAMICTYDAQKLARDFPNLDLYDNDGRAGVDIITISLMLSGTDASGTRRHYARQIVLNGEELLVPDQPAAPSAKRRRAAR